MPDLQPWVSVETLARHLNITCDTVAREIDARGLPDHHVARWRKLDLGDVDGRARIGGEKEPEAERGGVE